MKNLLIFACIALLFSCSYINLSKKNDNNCNICYGYLLKNCPSIVNKQIDTVNIVTTVFGQSLKTKVNISSICDSLWKYRNMPLVGDSDLTLINKKDNGLKQVIKVNKKTGEIKAECKSDTVYIKNTVYLTKDCIVNKQQVLAYLKAKSKYFYFQNKRYFLFLYLLITLLIIIYVKSKLKQ